MTQAIIVLIAYLFGSLPTALIVVKVVAGIDVRSGESGNMGAMNTLRMVGKTKGKTAGILSAFFVWAVDAAKAALAVWVCTHFLPNNVIALTATTTAVIAGHNYPIWLHGKGGRGAASLMGILLFFGFTYFAAWLAAVFLGSVLVELFFRIFTHQSITFKLPIHAVSDQIIGRLIGEVIAVYVVYQLNHDLLWPMIMATILVVYRHKERLIKQIHSRQ